MAQSRSKKHTAKREPLKGRDLYPSVNDNGRTTGETREEGIRRHQVQADVQIENRDGTFAHSERRTLKGQVK